MYEIKQMQAKVLLDLASLLAALFLEARVHLVSYLFHWSSLEKQMDKFRAVLELAIL